MSDKRLLFPQAEQFRDELQAAIDREKAQHAAERSWRHRLRGRPLTVTVAALVLGAGAAATASQLISVGDPVDAPIRQAPRYTPGDRLPVLAVTAPDAEVGHPWGVAVYDSPAGENCALAGQTRGQRLGVIQDDTFRPYPPRASGPCRKLTATTFVSQRQRFASDPPRTLLFGRAGPAAQRVRATVEGRVTTVDVGTGGAFLFVFDGNFRRATVELIDAAGRPVG